jgi:glucose/arabinose dehydrogenase
MKRISLLLGVLVLAGCGTQTEVLTSTTTSTTVSTEPVNTTVEYSTTVIGNIESPVDLVERSQEDSWMYVVSQSGIIQKWSRDGNQRTTILDISDATDVGGERGLLGLVFREVNGVWHAFLNRTDKNGDTVISTLPVNSDGTFMSTSDPGAVVIKIDQPYSNHNGGGLAIGPDNMLYIGMGDGGSANDPERRALDMTSLLGKMLRINPRPTGGYDIPTDNPFLSSENPEIWAIGVRNPWRFTFDPHGTMWVADVGQNKWEEITALPASDGFAGGRGANLGWSAYEGTHRFNTDVTASESVMPVYEYNHDNNRCSISGAAVGNNTSTPGRAGWFYFGDYCSGVVTAILTDGTTTIGEEVVAQKLGNIAAIRSTANTVYILSGDGKVRELKVSRQ